MQKLEEIKDMRTSCPKLFVAVAVVVCQTLLFAVLFSIAMIYVGSSNQYYCPIEPRVPTWLITNGAVSLVLVALFILYIVLFISVKEKNSYGWYIAAVAAMILVFLVIWFIAGNVWVYTISSTVDYYHLMSPFYCDKWLYLFTYWSISFIHFCVVLTVLTIIICICFYCFCAPCANQKPSTGI